MPAGKGKLGHMDFEGAQHGRSGNVSAQPLAGIKSYNQMDIPQSLKLHEHLIATLWFDEDGILHSVSKPAPRTIEIMTGYVACIKKMTNNQKVCILTDISNASPMSKEARAYSETEFNNLYRAMAIISSSSIGKMIGNIFLSLNTLSFPTKMFANEREAKGWLKKQL